MAIAQFSTKGQIVIPVQIRRKYGLRPGSKVEVLDVEDQIVLCPLPEDPIEAAEGFLTSENTVLEKVREARSEEKGFEERTVKRFPGR